MGHHAEHVAAFAEHAGDVFERAVGVGVRRDLARGSGVAEGDAILALSVAQHCRRRRSSCLPCGRWASGAPRPWSARVVKGESVVSVAQMDLLADVLEAGVAHQRAGQQAGLAEDLEAVADAHHEAAGVGKPAYRLHDWREARDGAGAQVVAVGEAAGTRMASQPSRSSDSCQRKVTGWCAISAMTL